MEMEIGDTSAAIIFTEDGMTFVLPQSDQFVELGHLPAHVAIASMLMLKLAYPEYQTQLMDEFEDSTEDPEIH